MTASSAHRSGGRRVPLLVALLVATLALAAVLAYQAQDAARSHRAAAERTLRDYAEFAAMGFAMHAKDMLYSRMYMALGRIGERRLRDRPGDGPIRPTLGGDQASASHGGGTESVDPCAGGPALMYFKLDLETGTLATSDACRSAALRRWLLDTVPAHARAHYNKSYDVAYIYTSLEDEPRVIAYRLKHDSANNPLVAYGFEANRARIGSPILKAVMEHTPLLPPSLTGGRPNGDFLSISVADLSGTPLFTSAHEYPPRYTGEMRLNEAFGGLMVHVALAPAAASALVIGGLPRSRLPLLVSLLLLVTGLIAVALLQLRREAELGRLRSGFIANVSHELRTPLAQIRMFAETLLLGRVRSSVEARRSLEIIDQEARRLTHLVENVLQYSRAERQVGRLTPELTSLAGEVRETVECFAPIALARQVRVATAIDEDAVAMVDRGAMRQVLTNLLDNAVKYGPIGQTVTVGLSAMDGRVRMRVDDEGPGVASALRRRIWEPFYRIGNGGDAIAGSGIGLAVVRELVEMHGGKCWVEDNASGGARFVVELARISIDAPVARGPMSSLVATPAAAPQS